MFGLLDKAMTVHRQANDYFEAAPPAVASAVRTVLARRPPYRDTIEIEPEAVFKTNVKPSWWLLGTNMTIRLQPSSGGTQIIAETKSQSFIWGDIFDFYNRYIQDFLRDLRSELRQRA